MSFSGQPIFTQLLKLVDRSVIHQIAQASKADRYYKKFKTYDHLICMLYAVLSRCQTLRELSTGMLACQGKINHLGLIYCPKRSTISDANKKRDSEVFRKIYMDLFRKYHRFLSDSHSYVPFSNRLYLVDSTTIQLFKEILKTGGQKAKNGRQKGGIKAHTVLRSDMAVPQFIHYTSAVTHDKHFLDHLKLTAGDFICMDRAYWDYAQFASWTASNIYFVTRMKVQCAYEVQTNLTLTEKEKEYGIKEHQIVTINAKGRVRGKKGRTKIQRVVLIDPKTKKEFVFMTNKLDLDTITVAEIYRHRWKIEKLFRKLKQNFPLKYFLGDNVNAIEIQIWSCFIAMLLISVFIKRISRKWAFSNIVSLISFHLMAYIDLIKFLKDPDKAWKEKNKKQLSIPNLFSSA
jgi:hypothetical protein